MPLEKPCDRRVGLAIGDSQAQESQSTCSSTRDEILEEAEELLEEVRTVTVNVGKIVAEEVKEGLEQLAAPEAEAEFGGWDAVAALTSVVAFNCDLVSDLLLARQLYLGDHLTRPWAGVTLSMTVLPLVIVNAFSLYWYWFDSQHSSEVRVSPELSPGRSEDLQNFNELENLRKRSIERRNSSVDEDEWYEIEDFYQESKDSENRVGNFNESKISEQSSESSLIEPTIIINDRRKKYVVQTGCDDDEEINVPASDTLYDGKQDLDLEGNKNFNSDSQVRASLSRRPNKVKRAIIWTFRILVHLVLQGSSLRQLDLVYYGTLSVLDKRNAQRRRPNTACFDPKQHEELRKTCPPPALGAAPSAPEGRILSLPRGSFENSNLDGFSTSGEREENFCANEESVNARGRYEELWLHAESDCAALDLLGAVLQDIPQIILQLYLLALSHPLLSSALLQYTSYFSKLEIDPWLFATFLNRIGFGNFSEGISDVSLEAIDGDYNSKYPNNSGRANSTTVVTLTNVNDGINFQAIGDMFPMSTEFMVTSKNVNTTPRASVVGLLAPEELLPETEKHLLMLQVVCLLGSLSAVSWSATSWVRAVRLASPRLCSLSPASLLLLTLAHVTAILPQVVSYAALAVASPRLLGLMLLTLWGGHSVWVLARLYAWSRQRSQLLEWFPHDVRTGWCRRADDVFVSTALALVFLLTYLDVSADESLTGAAVHALLRLTLQTVVAVLWWVSCSGEAWLQRGPLVFVFTAGALHAAFTFAYYWLVRRASAAYAGAMAEGTDEETNKLNQANEEFNRRSEATVRPNKTSSDTS